MGNFFSKLASYRDSDKVKSALLIIEQNKAGEDRVSMGHGVFLCFKLPTADG